MASLLGIIGDSIGGKLGDDVRERSVLGELGAGFDDLLSDLLDLSVLSIRALSDLASNSTGEGSDVNSQDVSISRLDFGLDIDEGVPFSQVRAEFISGDIQGVEVG